MHHHWKDHLWKSVIEALAEDALKSLFGPLADEIDFSRGVELVNKELIALVETPEESLKHEDRHVDFLFKVFTCEGSERRKLIHLEVQSQSKKPVTERIFEYFIKLRVHHKAPISTIVLYADKSPTYGGNSHTESFMGTSITLLFNAIKLLEMDEAKLRASDNPFDVVLLCAHLDLKRNKRKLKLIDLKRQITRHLLQKGFGREKIGHVFAFISLFVRLDDTDEAIFAREITQEYQENSDIMTLQEMFRERQIEIGVNLNLERVKSEGKAEGVEENRAEIIRNALGNGFSIKQITLLMSCSEAEIKNLIQKYQIK